ncbi:2,3-diaminopropionate biosynthesis protein SbnA [Tenacibaculum sp. M341]|uniref:2,3-diaminopropionate biosynthesis protein SbnA n=1 Tax=Tenacibaculum sp. M341 TaxID=2530339 RepID=UPI001045FA24|nr:2,3-diaminopropionate biosynthesis protein SbnA [Tenacibaculum sp. M341]TCI85713.1 2,3-diaminopropionate biosynthesis protein SbnA [Tenacibaculum sp. M341]
MVLTNILEKVGKTPLMSIELESNDLINIYMKLEFYNPTGSVKDRAASYVIDKILNTGMINRNTTLIESSSGNFGVALSAYAKFHDLKFICVIDKNTLPINEMLIELNGAEIIKINTPDIHGGYLLNRIKKIKQILAERENMYWVNQYENPLNAEAYYYSLGEEMCEEAPGDINYVFMGVSSGGTITGVSNRIKKKFPNAKIIAVDIYGSIVFDKSAKKRYIPGIGSSMKPKILKKAKIDEVVWVDEVNSVIGCRELLENHNIYAGGSSGSVYAGIKKYFSNKNITSPVNVMCIMADRGDRYNTTIYNDEWFEKLRKGTM